MQESKAEEVPIIYKRKVVEHKAPKGSVKMKMEKRRRNLNRKLQRTVAAKTGIIAVMNGNWLMREQEQ